uniref:Uncharacterized protein n=1 Tax=Rhizophora mucronata TaxID=61149 RepID=A0A2P2NI38_RHIMU
MILLQNPTLCYNIIVYYNTMQLIEQLQPPSNVSSSNFVTSCSADLCLSFQLS